MFEEKICPLLSINASYGRAPCEGDRCAWYVPPVHFGLEDGRCAMQSLGALPDLVREVRGL